MAPDLAGLPVIGPLLAVAESQRRSWRAEGRTEAAQVFEDAFDKATDAHGAPPAAWLDHVREHVAAELVRGLGEQAVVVSGNREG